MTASTPSRVQINLLGHPTIAVSGAEVSFDTRKAMALLSYLGATESGHTRDSLSALLWPESDSSRARGALRRTLSTIRSDAGPELLYTEGDVVRLRRPALEICDLAALRANLATVRSHRHGDICDHCVRLLDGATTPLRGPFLEGFSLRDAPAFDDWQVLEGEAVRREVGEALDLLAEQYVMAGVLTRAQATAERRLALEPLHEPTHRFLMDLHARRGDRAGALRRYRRCVEVLDRELGVPPAAATAELYQAIAGGRNGERAAPLEPSAARPVMEVGNPSRHGSDRPLTTLLDSLAEPAASFWAVEGEPGAGKTRLATDVAESLAARGRRVVSVRCHSDEASLAFGLIGDLIGELQCTGSDDRLAAIPAPLRRAVARAFPETGVAEPTDPGSADLRVILEGIAAVISACAGGASTLIVVDDLDRADPESLDALAYAVRRPQRHPLALLATWSDSRSRSGARLSHLAAEAPRGGIVRPTLFDRTDLAALAIEINNRRATDEQLDWLAAESGGLPLLAIEGARALGDTAERRPDSVRELLMRRIQGIDDVTGQILTTAAVAGVQFEFGVVAKSSGRSDEEVVEGIEALQRRGILVETDDGAYAFAHEGLRKIAYDMAGSARRRLLHRRMADALELAGNRASNRSGQIAHHLALAGRNDLAVQRFIEAAEAAAAIPAPTTAIDYFREALGLGPEDPAAIHERIGDVEVHAGAYSAARQSYEVALARSAHDISQLEHKLGRLHTRRGDWELAAIHLAAALDGAETDEVAACVLADWVVAELRRSQTQEAAAKAHRAVELSERSASPEAIARAANSAGLVAAAEGDVTGATRLFEAALDAIENESPADARIAVLNNLARTHLRAGRVDVALETATKALDACVALGDRHREAALRSNLADVLRAAGRPAESKGQLLQSAAILSEITPDTGELEPALWQLASW